MLAVIGCTEEAVGMNPGGLFGYARSTNWKMTRDIKTVRSGPLPFCFEILAALTLQRGNVQLEIVADKIRVKVA